MTAITAPCIHPNGGRNRLSAFDESLHQPTRDGGVQLAPEWQHQLRSFKVKPGVTAAELQSALSAQFGSNNLDEMVVAAKDGLHVVYGRGLARNIDTNDTFTSQEVTGTVVAVASEVHDEVVGLKLKRAALMTSAVLAPFVLGIPVAATIASLGGAWPLLGLTAEFATMVGGLFVATRGVDDEINFRDAKKQYVADRSVYAPFAADPHELVDAPTA